MNRYAWAFVGAVTGLGVGAVGGELAWAWVWIDYYFEYPPRQLPEELAEALIRVWALLAGGVIGAAVGYFCRRIRWDKLP